MDDQIAQLLRSSGLTGVTFRSVAKSTGAHPASLQYRFRTKAKLLECGLRQLVQHSLEDINIVESSLPTCGITAPALAQLMRFMTLGRPDATRADALVLLELVLNEDPLNRLLAWPWIERLGRFWLSVARAAGHDEIFAAFLADLHIGLLMHFSGSAARHEAALVCGEIVDRTFLGTPANDLVWFRRFHVEALSQVPEAMNGRNLPDPARAILAHAIDILRTAGPHGLSYRSLADAADVSVSAVTHYFPTSRILVFRAYRSLHRALIAHTLAEAADLTTVDPAAALRIAAYGEESGLAHFVCYSAFELYAEKNRDFAGLARYFRMTRGLYHLRKHDTAFDPYGEAACNSFAHSFALLGHLLRRSSIHSTGESASHDLAAIDFALNHFRIGEE